MGHGRLGPSEAARGASDIPQPPHPATSSRKRKLILLSLLSFALIIASAVSATLLVGLRTPAASSPGIHSKPTQAISKTCSRTRYTSLCVNTLLDFPGALSASEQDLVHISFNMTLQHFNRALYQSSGISFLQMDPPVRSAYDDCLELLDDSVDALSRSLLSVAPDANKNNIQVGSTNDVITWLSAALTNHDTCTEGFEGVSGDVKDQVSAKLKDLSQMVSNCLAIFSGSVTDDFAGVPIQNRRRLMEEEVEISPENETAFPRWLGREERELLSMPISAIRADIIVSNDGNGTCKTIGEAIKKSPEKSNRRTIIYVRAGR